MSCRNYRPSKSYFCITNNSEEISKPWVICAFVAACFCRLKHAVDRHINGEKSYDKQLERLNHLHGERIKKKREALRNFKKMCKEQRLLEHSNADESKNPVWAAVGSGLGMNMLQSVFWMNVWDAWSKVHGTTLFCFLIYSSVLCCRILMTGEVRSVKSLTIALFILQRFWISCVNWTLLVLSWVYFPSFKDART